MFSYKFDWAIITSGRYFDWLVSGVRITLELSAVSVVLSFFLGLLIAVMRMSNVRPVRWFAHGYLEFFRNTPLLVQIFFWYFGSYKLLPKVINDWLNSTNFEFTAAVIALTIYTLAFIAEDIRSGVRSIPKEQMEAARSSEFSYLRSMQYIILPQALRNMIPSFVNQFVSMIKDTSLAFIVGVSELTHVATQVNNRTMVYPTEIFLFIAVVYFIICFVFTSLSRWLEKRLSWRKAI